MKTTSFHSVANSIRRRRSSVRGTISENGQLRFFRRLAEGIFDEEDVVRRAHELADFILAATVEYQIDPADLMAVGYSNGANIAAAVLLLRPEVLAGAILFRAMLPLNSQPAPDLGGRRVLISAGEMDPIVPAENAQRLSGLLRAGGAEVTFALQPSGHGLVPGDLSAARDWLRDQ